MAKDKKNGQPPASTPPGGFDPNEVGPKKGQRAGRHRRHEIGHGKNNQEGKKKGGKRKRT